MSLVYKLDLSQMLTMGYHFIIVLYVCLSRQSFNAVVGIVVVLRSGRVGDGGDIRVVLD